MRQIHQAKNYSIVMQKYARIWFKYVGTDEILRRGAGFKNRSLLYICNRSLNGAISFSVH